MAMTATLVQPMNARGGRMNLYTGQTNENYATGGFAVTPNMFGLNTISNLVIPSAVAFAGGAYTCSYSGGTGKILVYWVDTTVDGSVMVEVPNGTAMGLTFYTILAIGK